MFLDPGKRLNEAQGREPGRRAPARHPRRARLREAAAAPVGPPRGSGQVLCGAFKKEVCSGVAGGDRDGSDPPGAAPPLTPSLTNAPSERVVDSEPTLPKPYTNLIKPNAVGRNAPCSPKAKAPPSWALSRFPLPALPVPSALLPSRAQPRGNLGARGSQRTWPPAARRPFTRSALHGRGEGAPSAAGEEWCG